MSLPFAEDVNYWRTGRSSADVWMAKAKGQIEDAGGKVLQEGFGMDGGTGRAAYMLSFAFNAEVFKVIWPVLPTKAGLEKDVRRQAATMLFHDVKARAVSAKVLGARTAFFAYLLLPDGRNVGMASDAELMDGVPTVLALSPPMEEGEYEEEER